MENLTNEKVDAVTEGNEINEEQEEKNNEEMDIEKQEQLKLEREELDKEEGIEFQEIITKDDALKFNFYLQNNSSNFSRRLFSSLLGVFLIGYVLNIKQYYGLIIVGLAIIVYSCFLYVLIQRKLTERMFNKNGFENLTVNVKLASKIKYELDTEKISPLVSYELIKYAVKTDEYIYLHLSQYSVIIIKLIDCQEKRDEVIEFIKNKYESSNRYKVK